MAWNDWIVKHAKAITVAWVLIILLAAPLAYKLNDVTNYSMDQFLPKDVESVKVQDTLNEQFPSFSTSQNQTYMIIHGVDVNDLRTWEAYERFKAEAKPYGDNFTSYYDALDLLTNKSYEIALNLTRLTANLTGGLYNSTVEMNETYSLLLQNMSELLKRINQTKGALQETAKAYGELRKNLSEGYGQVKELQEALNETASAYLELQKNLTELYGQMMNLSEAINETAAEYPKVKSQLNELYAQMMDLRETLQETSSGYLEARENLTTLYFRMVTLRGVLNETDTAYRELHENLSQTSEMLKSLNATIAKTNVGLYSLNATYGRAYAGTVGVYKALAAAGAYSRGSLDEGTAEVVATETKTSTEFVYAVFNATNPVYQSYGAAAITDGLLANVTSGIVLSTINDPMEEKLAEVYAYSFYLAVEGFDRAHGSDYAIQGLPSDELVEASSQLATMALESTPRVVMESGESLTVPGFGEVDSRTLSTIVHASISLGPSPEPPAVENATVNFAMVYISTTQPNSPLLSLPDPASVLRALLLQGPTRELEENLLLAGAEEKADNSTRPFVPLVVNATMSYDPNATGVLSRDADLLENATITVMEKILAGMGTQLNVSVLRELYESEGNEQVIGGIARELVLSSLEEEMKGRGVENYTMVAQLVANESFSDPQGILNNSSKLEDATIGITERLVSSKGINLDEDTLREVYESGGNETVISEIVRRLLYGSVEKGLERKGTENTKELAALIVNASLSSPAVVSNGSVLENTTIGVMETLLRARNVSVERTYLEELYESNGNVTTIRGITKNVLVETVAKELKERGVEGAEDIARGIVETNIFPILLIC
jgi:predicted  nucleic acid-binding Zn-ribbon protein